MSSILNLIFDIICISFIGTKNILNIKHLKHLTTFKTMKEVACTKRIVVTLRMTIKFQIHVILTTKASKHHLPLQDGQKQNFHDIILEGFELS
jgi:hypothetical protein